MASPLFLCGFLFAGVSACSSEESASDPDEQGAGGTSNTGGTSTTGGASNTGGTGNTGSTSLVGTFSVSLVEPVAASGDTPSVPGFTTIVGKVFDGPIPEGTIWEVSAEDGDCRLLEPRVPFCDPACGTEVCVEDGQCQARPTSVDVGTVHVKGVGDTEFSMTPIANSYQPGAGVSLPYPAFEPGAAISIQAEGGAAGAFTVEALGIAPFELTSDSLSLVHDVPLELAWTAGTVAEAKVLVKLDISHHGGSKGKIECEAADSGALSIAGSLISKLLDLGVAGFPTIVVGRETRGTNGGVELAVSSNVEHAVEIEGLVSCTDGTECASGVCRSDLTCEP